jgi:hypothetical protein
MLKYARLNVDPKEYEGIKITQLKNKSQVQEQFLGSRRKLFSNGVMIATLSSTGNLDIGKITKQQFNSFLGGFTKQLYKQLKDSPDLMTLHIDFNESSRAKNYYNWDKLKEGDFFYNIDLNSAYWQVAHKLNYLSDKMFETYIDLDEYKMVKRLCISFLARTNKRRYYLDNDETMDISCNTDVLRQVYQNIRYYLYNVVFEGVQITDEWIEYNIDGITVLNTDVDVIQKYFDKADFKYKITECRKLSDTDYLYGNSVRKFRNR